jgi:hypothetical protein
MQLMTRIRFYTLIRPLKILWPAIPASLVLFLAACAGDQAWEQSPALQACHVVFDAGSSGTRLYIYRQSGSGWVRHDGPKTDALADPVRGRRGKTIADAEDVTTDIVALLDDWFIEGPPKKRSGEPKWLAFDWWSQCRVESASVYATAGMRLAEIAHPGKAEAIWEMLNQKLSDRLDLEVKTRTLSGFEEGLFAWLAVREGQADGMFGIAEMGGASAQVTLPCDDCRGSRPVLVQGKKVLMHIGSYLGLGQDEMWRKVGDRSTCKRAVGLKNPQWRVMDCTDGIVLSAEFQTDAEIIASRPDIDRWFLTGAFRYTQATDIENYCRANEDSGHKPKSSCFRAVYQSHFLNSLGIPISSEYSAADWTLGAVICDIESCLSFAGPPECEWSQNGCL